MSVGDKIPYVEINLSKSHSIGLYTIEDIQKKKVIGRLVVTYRQHRRYRRYRLER
jgi:type IV secretory pathway protease TraF